MSVDDRLEKALRHERVIETQIGRLRNELEAARLARHAVEDEWLRVREEHGAEISLLARTNVAGSDVSGPIARPIGEAPTSGVTEGPLTEAVEQVLHTSAEPLKAHQIASILRAAGRQENIDSINTTLSNLCKKNRAFRHSRGSYGPAPKRDYNPLLASHEDVLPSPGPSVTIS